MRARSRVWPLVAFALLAAVGCEDDDDITGLLPVRNFTVTMTGAKERPNPISPSGSGTVTLTLNEAETALNYSITVQSMTSNITAAHIHLGDATSAGSIIVGLTTPTNNGTVTGTLTNSSTLSLGVTWPLLLSLMRSGNAYINVHTSNNPGGEIRGQIEAATP